MKGKLLKFCCFYLFPAAESWKCEEAHSYSHEYGQGCQKAHLWVASILMISCHEAHIGSQEAHHGMSRGS